jgi:hypothetical protein
MKLIDPDAIFMGFHFFGIVYTWFHLNETSLLFFYKFFTMS